MREDGSIQPAKVTHFTQQGFQIKGVIHAGMNDAEEVYSYKDLGIQNIIGFEPLPYAVSQARLNHPGLRVVEVALGNKDSMEELIVTKGDGKGSSIYEPILESEEVKKNWRDNGIIVGRIPVKIMRYATWIEQQDNFSTEDYDCLVLDTQGNEMDVLLGMGQYLQDFKYLSIELSETPVYESETKAQLVVDWLKVQGFTQDSQIQPHNDVMFVRSDIKPISDLRYWGLA